MRIEAVRGDITTQQVDAVVNAANSSLLGGEGVDGAIHRAAGPDLLRECLHLRETTLPRGLPVGQAVATGAGRMAARWVVHTVGPDANRGQNDPRLLTDCFVNSLAVAGDVGAHQVAFPAVSAGAFGWEPATVATIAVTATRDYATDPCAAIELVRFVLFSDEILGHFQAALEAAA